MSKDRGNLATDGVSTPCQFGFLSKDGAQTVDGSSASAQSTAFTVTTSVRVSSVGFTDCWIEVDTDPTAVAESAGAILVNGTEYMRIEAGDKIAVIGGKLNICPALA